MKELIISGCKLVMTCSACPEQYDVFNGRGRRIAYLRLRHGCFTAEVPYVGGDRVYYACPGGDGSFRDEERDFYLVAAIAAIKEHIKDESKK